MSIILEESEYRKHAGSIHPAVLAESINKELSKPQKEIAEYFTTEGRQNWQELFVLASRRLGKSWMLRLLSTSELFTPYGKAAVISPGSTKLALEHLDVIATDLKRTPVEKELGISVRRQERKIISSVLNSSITFTSEEAFQDDLIGRSVSTLFVDEMCLFRPNKWEEIYQLIEPTMNSYGVYETGMRVGKFVYITTPRGILGATPQSRKYQEGLLRKNGVVSLKYTIYDNPFMSPEEIELKRKTTNLSTWNQEYLCEWGENVTSVLHKFRIETHVADKRAFIKQHGSKATLVIGLDQGMRDGNAACFMIHIPEIDTYFIVDEYYKKQELPRDFVKVVKRKEEEIKAEFGIDNKNVNRFYDPSAAVLAKEAIEQKYYLTRAVNDIDAGFTYLNGLLEGTPDQGVQLFVDPRCKETQRQFAFASFKETSTGMSNQFAHDSEGTHFDVLVAARYAAYTNKIYGRKTFISVV